MHRHIQTKHNPEKQNMVRGKTKQPCFSRIFRHSARKRGWLILQRCRTRTGQ